MEIGGYFNLELHPRDHFLHDDGIFVNSGRHALEYVLRTIPRIDCIYIPYYTCRVVQLPLEKMGLKYKRYEVDRNLHLAEQPDLGEYDYIIYTNYFGILDSYIEELARIYGDKLIVDNAQALYADPIPGIRTAYSPRKFIGVADGGIAYSPTESLNEISETDISAERSEYLLYRFDYPSAKGYVASKESNKTIEGESLKWMSKLTKRIYSSTDFGYIKEKRRQNFECLNKCLETLNCMELPSIDSFKCPLIYPFYCIKEGLLPHLISKGIFVAVYWPYVIQTCKDDSTAVDLSKHIIALPIDQRYGESEMEYIIKSIKEYLYA